MNKKQIAALVETMVKTVMDAQSVTEDIARTLVGLAIEKNQAALTTVTIPTLTAAPAPAAD
jgi:hypothetical protein